MSDEKKSCCNSGNGEPTATRSAAPMWIIVVTLALLFAGGLFLDSHSGWFNKQVYPPYQSSEQLESFQPKSGEAVRMARGKAFYENVCAICHASDGAGKPGQFPPLAGSEWVIGKGHNRLIRIPLAGMMGPIKVKGQDWNLNMAPMGAALPDEDVAALLTYIRSAWGNKAEAVPVEDVKKVRAEIGKSPQPYNGEQLLALPE